MMLLFGLLLLLVSCTKKIDDNEVNSFVLAEHIVPDRAADGNPIDERGADDVIETDALLAGDDLEKDILIKDDVIETLTYDSFMKMAITDDILTRIENKSYKEDCTIPLHELSYIKVLHYGFDGEIHEGELIVNQEIADDVIDIFKELFEAEYPIEKMVLIDEYEADDNLSMMDNNTSSFNYRVIQGSDSLSNHAKGMAIDINPLYNPYVRVRDSGTTIFPETAKEYTDRDIECAYYIKKDDVCYNAFTKRGFTWGGDWNTVKDYQHFEKN